MDFGISEEYMMLKEAMKEFVKRELMPLEKTLLERDMSLWTKPGPLIPKERFRSALRGDKGTGILGD